MMAQTDGQPIHERPGYEGYEGNQSRFQQPQYEPPYGQSSQRDSYDDNFVEALAQRIAQIMKQGTTKKVPSARSNQNIGLAIVSIVMLVPLAAITLGILGWLGLIPFAVACLAIVIVNAMLHGNTRI